MNISENINYNKINSSKIRNIFESKGLCGLINRSNSCYINCAVQCLSNSLPLTYFFLNKDYLTELDENKKEYNLIIQWGRLLEGIWEENCTIYPESLIKSIQHISSYKKNIFHNFDQQDFSELIVFIIDNLHEGLSRPVSIDISGVIKNEDDKITFDSMKIWKDYFKNNYSIIIELFYGQYISIVESIDNSNLPIEKSFTYEPFCILDLEIPDTNSDIYNCFDLLISESILNKENKWYSDKTKSYRDAKRQMMILNLPEILIISFKRFNYNVSKKNNNIEFPIDELNLEKYIFNPKKKNCRYSLFAICNHVGNTQIGHYYSYCRNIDNNWYHFDDDSVKIINKNEIITNKAYCLFYQKKKF